MLARIEALLRRVPIRTGQVILESGSLRLDMRRMEVTRDSKPVYLTVREFQLLRYLISRTRASLPSRNADRNAREQDQGYNFECRCVHRRPDGSYATL